MSKNDQYFRLFICLLPAEKCRLLLEDCDDAPPSIDIKSILQQKYWQYVLTHGYPRHGKMYSYNRAFYESVEKNNLDTAYAVTSRFHENVKNGHFPLWLSASEKKDFEGIVEECKNKHAETSIVKQLEMEVDELRKDRDSWKKKEEELSSSIVEIHGWFGNVVRHWCHVRRNYLPAMAMPEWMEQYLDGTDTAIELEEDIQ